MMKTKLTLASLILSGSIVMIFAAAKVETCAETYKQCSSACSGELSKCKLSGRPDETCEQAHKACMKKCDNDKAECEKNNKKS